MRTGTLAVARAIVPALLLLLGSAGRAAACASCYGLADGPMIDAARLGVWLLLGVTLFVQGGFAAFFIYLRRRAARAATDAMDEEWSQLQREWDESGGVQGT